MLRPRFARLPHVRRAFLVTALSLITALGAGPASADDPAPGDAPEVGKRYPALRLPTIDRTRTIDLRSFRGKRMLLIEFASW